MRGPAAAAWFAAALSIAACAPSDPPATDHFPALGTLVEVTVRGVPREVQPEVFRALRSGFDRAQRDWHAWNDGELARYNAAAVIGEPFTPTPPTAALLAQATAMHGLSGGLFDPSIGALVEAWGFHDTTAVGDGPPIEAIAAWRAGTLPRRVDLGGIAKGAAVADALQTLHAHGVRDALVNAGGDVAARGDAGGRPWRIGIRNPRGVGVIAGIELADGEVLFTSGDYERVYERDGVRFHHLLDPRTGYPAAGSASVTVLHRDPVLADAAATALFVAGGDWRQVATSMGVALVARITPDGAIEVTEAMAGRLILEPTTNPFTVIEEHAARR